MNFVTGGTGIVGSQLLYDLVSGDETVKALKRVESNLNTVKKLFAHFNQEHLFEKIEWVDGDILDMPGLLESFEGVKRVFHCAAHVSFDPRDKKEMEQVNIQGTANVVNACLQGQVEELVYVSSTAAIGKQKKGKIIDESLNWDAGVRNSHYSFTKYMAELEVWRGAEEGLNVAVVNPGVIVGPGEWGKSSTNVFKTVWNGLRFYSPGANAFVDVRDVSRAMLELSRQKIFAERFLLIAENMSFKEFFEHIASAIQKNPPSVPVNRIMSAIAWRLNWLTSVITGAKPLITRETARSAFGVQEYSNQKIKDALDFEFTPIKQAIDRTGNMFLSDYR